MIPSASSGDSGQKPIEALFHDVGFHTSARSATAERWTSAKFNLLRVALPMAPFPVTSLPLG
jgi:hypothetical protein